MHKSMMHQEPKIISADVTGERLPDMQRRISEHRVQPTSSSPNGGSTRVDRRLLAQREMRKFRGRYLVQTSISDTFGRQIVDRSMGLLRRSAMFNVSLCDNRGRELHPASWKTETSRRGRSRGFSRSLIQKERYRVINCSDSTKHRFPSK